jgi:hypothetical protein
MKIIVKSASPDGMTVEFETFLMSWEDLKGFVDWVIMLESGEYKKFLCVDETKKEKTT